MKLIKKQISGITYFSIDNLSISLDVSKRYSLNLWSEGTQKQGNYAKTLYFDDTLEEWRTRDCECSNKDKSLDFSIIIKDNVLKSLETLKIYGIDNGGVHIFNEVYFELHEIGGGSDITDYTESVIAERNNVGVLGDRGYNVTITNIVNGEESSQTIQVPHEAIARSEKTDPFEPTGLDPNWFKFYYTADYSSYAIWFRTVNSYPIRVLTQWDLFKNRFDNYVKFTANENSSIEVITTGTVNVDLQYSFDGISWKNYTSTLNHVERGQTVLFKGNNPTGFNIDTNNFINFNLIGDISVSGNVMGLLDNGAGNTTEIPNESCFVNLFLNSTGITSISKNFLPALTLKASCYAYMFNGCTNLRQAPNLPATTVTNSGYSWMFNGCSSLAEAPELPATTLEQYCYNRIFRNCISLTKAPTLPATTLATACYKNMFENCKSLFFVKILFTGNFADVTDAFNNWLLGTPSYAIIYYNGSDTATGTSAIPTNWVKVTF